jgi:hypothetical protein
MTLPIKTSIKAPIKQRHKLCLLSDWKRIARRAWSVRLSIVAALFTAAEIVVPLLGDVLPRGLFVLLAFTASIGAAIARLVAQPEMHS